MSTTSVDGFCELLAQSELLTKDQLNDVRDEIALTDDAVAAARTLVQKQQITKWQAKMLLSGRCAFKLGKYILLDRIGNQESGDVYAAKHAQLGKRVAIKTLSRADTQDSDRLKLMFALAREIANLDHRNITHTFDIDSEDDRYFLVMEHVEGEDLRAVVERGGPLSPVVVGNYIVQAAKGLTHAHEKGILHRGVDPMNLLVDGQDTIKLLNLGMSQLHSNGANGANGKSISPDDFMSPEIKAGRKGDHRSDIYGLGCTGLYLLTGKKPSEVVRKPTTGLEKVLRKMMANDPSNRVQTAESVASLLEKWLLQHAPTAAPEITVDEPASAETAKMVEEIAESEPDEASEVDTIQSVTDDANVADDTGLADFAINVGRQNSRAASARPTQTFSDTIEIAAGDTSKSKKSNKEPSMKPQTQPVRSSRPLDKAPAPNTVAAGAKRTPAATRPANRFSAGAIVGLAIGGSAMLLACITVFISLIYWLVFSGTDPAALAKNDAQQAVTNVADKTDAANGNETGDDKSSDQGGDSKRDETTPKNAGQATADNPPANSDVPTNGNPETKPDVPKPGGQPEPEKKAEPEVKPMPMPMPATPAPPMPMPATPAPMPMPAPPKPAPPKVAVNAFANLPPAKNLPELGTAAMPVAGFDAPLVFGDMKVDAADILLVSLEGGEEASRTAGEKFLIENARGGTALRDFEITIQHTDESKVLIAKLWIEEDKLKFQWTPAAQNEPNSNYLRNCVLSMQAGASVKDVTLREPAVLGSLVPNFEKDSSITQQYAADWLPDPSKVRVEITVDKNFPPHRFDPVNELDAAGGKAKVLLGEEITLPDNIRFFPAYLTFESKLRRNGGEIEVALLTTYALKGKPVPGKYVEKKVDDSIKAFQSESALVSNGLLQVAQRAKGLKNDREKQEAEVQLNFLNESQKTFNAMIAAYGAVKAYPAKIQGTKISATVFFLAGEYKVILAKN